MDDVAQEDQPLEENIPQSNDDMSPVYDTEEFQPLESITSPDDEDSGSVYTTQEVQPLEDVILQVEEEAGTAYSTQEDQPLEESISQTEEDYASTFITQEVQPLEENTPQTDEDSGPVNTTQEAQPLEDSNSQPDEIIGSTFTVQEVAREENTKKIALILSGGGARGAFQVGAEKYAREVKGYQWDIIAGVSVGAMNGAMLAMHRYSRLMELWNTISNEQVYSGGFNLLSVIKLLIGAKSFYSNTPLQKMMEREFEAGRIIDDLHVGAVSLISGEYVSFTKEFLELPSAILASASIPVVWPPVDISPEHPAMVDGGVRNNTPVGDVLDLEPDEIVIINCSPEKPPTLPRAAVNVLSIGMRAIDIMQNEIFINDMKEFLRINALVKEAEGQGTVLHHPRTGRPLKYYPCVVIEPDNDLGETLDFSKQSVQTALRAGVRRAREALGRPGAMRL